jgi:hypothetical protein
VGLRLCQDAKAFPTSTHAILAAEIRPPELLWLTRTLLFHDPTSNYRLRSFTPGAPGPGSSDRYPIPLSSAADGLDLYELLSQERAGLPEVIVLLHPEP